MDNYSIISEGIRKVFRKEEGGILSFNRRKEEIVALERIDLEVKKGELFGLLGPNGAGKTTFIKILSTLIIPDSGRASVNGYDVLEQPKEVRRSIGVVSGGERSLYWKLTAEENLEYFARLYKVPGDLAKRRIKELLSLMGLEDRAKELVEKYSSGMKQKLAIARAILHDPEVLLLDEPTLGLDPNFARNIREFIKEEINRKQRKTILLTTHYMEEAEQLCDRIAFINKGKIVAIGTPEQLKESVKKFEILKVVVTNVTNELLDKLNKLPYVESYNVSYGNLDSTIIRFFMREVEPNLQEIVKMFSENRSKIVSIEIKKPNLEDVFIKLTGEEIKDESERN